jgi:hypothetical protein
VPERVLQRAGLLFLGLPGVVVGAWAAFAPRSFFDDFPGLGQQWVAPDGVFNEHLVRDVGELTLALALVALVAVVWPSPALVRVAAGAWLVDGVPHLVYHLRHLGPLAPDAKVSSIAALALGPLVAVALLVSTVPGTGARRARGAMIGRSNTPSSASSTSVSTASRVRSSST